MDPPSQVLRLDKRPRQCDRALSVGHSPGIRHQRFGQGRARRGDPQFRAAVAVVRWHLGFLLRVHQLRHSDVRGTREEGDIRAHLDEDFMGCRSFVHPLRWLELHAVWRSHRVPSHEEFRRELVEQFTLGQDHAIRVRLRVSAQRAAFPLPGVDRHRGQDLQGPGPRMRGARPRQEVVEKHVADDLGILLHANCISRRRAHQRAGGDHRFCMLRATGLHLPGDLPLRALGARSSRCSVEHRYWDNGRVSLRTHHRECDSGLAMMRSLAGPYF
mmetsp:Transcript_70901/g.203142  ORF Transcript_70901/g.203142 Transcript_70901/m.203142 type:complete len:272 (-) Transcript_70901:96-911(-)